MADEDWDNVDESGNAAAAAGAAPIMAEMPEIKLFGKWSCDDVEVVDMSLQVRENQLSIHVNICTNWNPELLLSTPLNFDSGFHCAHPSEMMLTNPRRVVACVHCVDKTHHPQD